MADNKKLNPTEYAKRYEFARTLPDVAKKQAEEDMLRRDEAARKREAVSATTRKRAVENVKTIIELKKSFDASYNPSIDEIKQMVEEEFQKIKNGS